MSYKVVKLFDDLQDDAYRYQVGDTYPRKGLKPSEGRIKELLGSKNLQGEPLITKVTKEKE